MPEIRPRLPAPGPSFLREMELRPGDVLRVGMSQPQTIADGWWVALLWCEQDGALVEPGYGVRSDTS